MHNRLVNRLVFPTRHVLVCEDDTEVQAAIAARLARLFGGQGHVQVSLVPGAAQAAGLIAAVGVEVILLDHDMPFGNGPDLLSWLKATERNVPVITFSGISANNDNLMALGAHHRFEKQAVLDGAADDLLRAILGVS
jgi:CheY-like chemotaxis protein